MSPNEDFICNNCIHLRPFSGGCDAFPEDIPFEMGIFFDHNKPIPGQKNNIVFEKGIPKEIENLKN